MTSGAAGRRLRLARILRPTGRTVILPMDDAVIGGPTRRLARPLSFLEDACEIGADAVLGYAGTLAQIPPHSSFGRVANLTASTVHHNHTRKYAVSTIAKALADGADAAAVHVNITSKFEGEMIGLLGMTIAAAQPFNLPILAIMYPRKERADSDDNYEELLRSQPDRYASLVSHAVRIAVELGADIVKTQYTGSAATFRAVVDAACGVPVVIAGGRLGPADELYRRVEGAIEAGAAGVSIGRNVHQVEDTNLPVLKRLIQIVHGE